MNSYTILDARVVSAPRAGKANNKAVTSIRVADNPQGSKEQNEKAGRIARFVTIKGWEKQAELLAKLSQGDVISVTGELIREKFTDKQGQEREDDVIRLSSFKVQKSDSFFGTAPTPAGAPPDDTIPF